MNPMARTRVPLLIPFVSALAVMLVAGCGGGNGGHTPTVGFYGRSFSAADANRTFSISIDRQGRLTVYTRDSAALPAGVAAQGSVGSDGRFTLQSAGGVVITGTISADGSVVAGSVLQGNATLYSFSAPIVPAGRVGTSGYSGTYTNGGAAGQAMISVDLSGHATLYAVVGATTGGGLITISQTGAFESADGSGATTGQITLSGTDLLLRLDKLNGVVVNTNFTLPPLTRAKWSFLVFINGANNLDEFGPLNVNQMEKIGSNKDLNIVLQWKRANCGTCGNPDWVGTRRYFVTKDTNEQQVSSQIVQNMGTNIDMGDWRELRNFIQWGQQQYPADHYAVVIWNHGAGWRPTRAGQRQPMVPRSVSIDDSTNNEIQTWQLPGALTAGQRLDMVIFDASLMQMMEVAYEMKDITDVIVGSEESPPGEGYVYDRFLADLAANPNMTAAQFGTSIVERTLEAYGRNNNLTQSALDTSKIANLAGRISSFANTLEANISNSRDAMVFARRNAENYAYPDNKDLWHYAELIKQNTASSSLKASATDVQNAIDAATIAEEHGTINGNSHGVAIYVPAPIDYLPSYSNLAFSRATDWDRWLQNQPGN